MKQTDFGSDLAIRRTRKRALPGEIERTVPRRGWSALVVTHSPVKPTGHPRFPVELMLRIDILHQWFGLSDFAMEYALADVPLCQRFDGLVGMSRLLDRFSILRVRYLLEERQLADQFLKTVNQHLARAVFPLKERTESDATRHPIQQGQRRRGRPGNASHQKGQPVVLPHEGAYSRGC